MDVLNLTATSILDFLNVAMTSVVVILAFSLLAYTLTYNIGDRVARRFALLLCCVMLTYAGEVALNRVLTAESAARWLRFQWLGIALLPAAYYTFSLAVLQTTNYRVGRRRWVAWSSVVLSIVSAAAALFGAQLVGDVHFAPPISYLEAGPYFAFFTVFFALTVLLSLGNIWKARQRCLSASSRKRMTYLLLGFVAPGVGIFPYLIALGRVAPAVGGPMDAGMGVLLLSIVGNAAVAVMLVMMSYTVAYFGVLTPDRVVRYRLLRFFARGPAVAILVILAVQTVPTVERILGLPRNIALFSVITGVIILSQLILSVTRSLVDRLIYREDQEEIAWLRELDRRLLTTSDMRQFLENNLIALCELLRVQAGFVAVAGPDVSIEAVVGADETRAEIAAVTNWSHALDRVLVRDEALLPLSHAGFWVWPLLDAGSTDERSADEGKQVLGILGVQARTMTPLLGQDEVAVLEPLIQRVGLALTDRRLQQGVFVALRKIIPDIDRIQQLRGVVPYTSVNSTQSAANALLNPSPIHNPEFEAWVKDALSHYWGGPKLTQSPLVQLHVVNARLDQADGNPTKALRMVLGSAIEKLRPAGKPSLGAPEWLLYNILEMRFIQGRKVREIANRLAISESDLYRKQRVAVGQVARVLTEMEQGNGEAPDVPSAPGSPSHSLGSADTREQAPLVVHS